MTRRERWQQRLGVAALIALLVVLGTFANSLLNGDQGLQALSRAETTEAELEAELAILKAQRAEAENRTGRLADDALDLDLLDEEARRLGYLRDDEVVVPWPPAPGQSSR